MDDWIRIVGFTGYSVSWLGDVRNDSTERILRPRLNQYGVPFVGLMKDGEQRQRSVALLVAQAFLDPPPTRFFDTPINLDGDRLNNRVDNLAWRARWFAVQYNHQFKERYSTPIDRLLRDNEGQEYQDSWQAAIKNGLLEKDVVLSVLNEDRPYLTWPTQQRFRVV